MMPDKAFVESMSAEWFSEARLGFKQKGRGMLVVAATPGVCAASIYLGRGAMENNDIPGKCFQEVLRYDPSCEAVVGFADGPGKVRHCAVISRRAADLNAGEHPN